MRVQTEASHVVLRVHLRSDSLDETLHCLVHDLLEQVGSSQSLVHGFTLWHTLALSCIIILIVVGRAVFDMVTRLVATLAHEVRRQILRALAARATVVVTLIAGTLVATSRRTLLPKMVIVCIAWLVVVLALRPTASLIIRLIVWFH